MSMSSRRCRTIACALGIALVGVFQTAAQSEAGGTSGADFLIAPPAPRADAMGGALDGLGENLEGILFNPAVLAGATDVGIQIHLNPLPNEVTHAQASVGIPLAGGLMAVSAQLFNAGTFQFVDASGNPGATSAIYDIAAVAGYSRYLWRSLSAGLSVKGIYRSLGDYNAFAVGIDAGVAMRFETPHIGQAPKPPTLEQLEKEYLKDKAGLDSEKEHKIGEAAAAIPLLRASIEKLEATLVSQNEKIAAQEDEEKKQEIQAARVETEEDLDRLRATLREEEAAAADALGEIDQWYAEQLANAQARYDAKLATQSWIGEERAKLFEVVDDPQKELVQEIIDENIDDIIDKTRDFLEQRTSSLTSASVQFEEKRRTSIQALQADAQAYQQQISDELGPVVEEISREIEALEARKAELAEKTDGGNADNAVDYKAQIKEVEAQIARKRKELAELDDAWIRRLRGRIEAKAKEITAYEADIVSNAADTEKAIADAAAEAERDIADFEELREWLRKELQKAKLKRELDLINARNEAREEKAIRDYKAKEEKLYLRLLAAMYDYEDRTFQIRLSLVREQSLVQIFDFDAELRKEQEAAEEDFLFQERYLTGQIREAEREEKQTDGETSEDGKAAALQKELDEKRLAYEEAVQKLVAGEKQFRADQTALVAEETAQIKAERQKIRLVYLQTDEPYQNTSVQVGVRNVGTNVKFAEVGYPLPSIVSAAFGYALMNTDKHSVKLSAQLDISLLEVGTAGADALSVSVGAEYVFSDMVFIRGGYTFNNVDRSFSAGFGLKIPLGFTEYVVEYAFRPLPDYGFLHSIGVAMNF